MQGKGITLRLGLLGLVVVLVLSAVGGLSLARDAFDDNEYEDCPAATRLDAVDGLAVDRTDEEKEIRISWDALTDAELSSLGPNGYRARLTVIVEGSGDDKSNNVALGDTSLVVEDVTLASDLTISVAITLGDFVISDIAEREFTSGMPKPGFYTVVNERPRVGTEDEAAAGAFAAGIYAAPIQRFYYLGFNDLFDNWFVGERPAPVDGVAFETEPSVAKFRVGLAHASGVNPEDAGFDHYRIVIEDGSGDLLGYQAQTVNAERTYGNGNNRIVFGEAGVGTLLNGSNLTSLGAPTTVGARAGNAYKGFTNIRLSNQVTDGPAMSPYYASIIALETAAQDGTLETAFVIPDSPGEIDLIGLSYGNVLTKGQIDAVGGGDDAVADAVAGVVQGLLYVDPPQEYFDFPGNVFEDDGAYVIKAWAEDDDGTRISPVASIKLSVREGDSVGNSAFLGYVDDIRSWGETSTGRNLELAVYGLSIEDE